MRVSLPASTKNMPLTEVCPPMDNLHRPRRATTVPLILQIIPTPTGWYRRTSVLHVVGYKAGKFDVTRMTAAITLIAPHCPSSPRRRMCACSWPPPFCHCQWSFVCLRKPLSRLIHPRAVPMICCQRLWSSDSSQAFTKNALICQYCH